MADSPHPCEARLETTSPEHHSTGSQLRDMILGGQDGLVNVLGVVLGATAATTDARVILSIGLAATFAESLAMGAVAFFVVAAAGALWRAKSSRAIRWARSNPWRFAVAPALAVAAIALVLSVVTGGGIIDPVLSALWHGAVAYALTGVAGATRKSRKRTT